MDPYFRVTVNSTIRGDFSHRVKTFWSIQSPSSLASFRSKLNSIFAKISLISAYAILCTSCDQLIVIHTCIHEMIHLPLPKTIPRTNRKRLEHSGFIGLELRLRIGKPSLRDITIWFDEIP